MTTYTASTVCAVAGVNSGTLRVWRARGFLEMDDPDQEGWTRYNLREMLRACAVAELANHGIPPGNARDLFLVDGLTRDLRMQMPDYEERQLFAGGVFAGTKAWWRSPPGEPRYFVAQSWATGGKEGLDMRAGLSSAEVHKHLEKLSRSSDELVTVIVIDTAKMLKRILRKLRAHELSGEETGD